MKTPERILKELALDRITLSDNYKTITLGKAKFELLCKHIWRSVEVSPLDDEFQLPVSLNKNVANWAAELSSGSRKLFRLRDLLRFESVRGMRAYIRKTLLAAPGYHLQKRK